jgi:hypothetical protein
MALILFETSWEDYFCKCKDGLGKFKKDEERLYPENRLFFHSARHINEEFKKALDEVKTEAGFVPGEVYISTKSNGELAVNLGATLLNIEILFKMTINIRSVSRKYHKKSKPFSFERYVAEEYDRCVFEYERLRREMKSTWKACDVTPGELDRAIRLVEKDRQNAFEKLSAFRRNHCAMAVIKYAELEVANLNLLLKKLSKYYPRRA